MKSKRIVAVVIVVLVAVVILVGLFNNKDTGTVKIGIVAPLSGNLAFMGEGVENAARLAIENLGETKYKYELVIEDDAFDPKRTASAVNKLISIDKVSGLVTFASAAGSVTSPIAEKNKVIHFSVASDPTIAKGDYNFIHWTPPAEEARTLVSELEKRGIKKIAIFGANISGIIAVADEINKLALEKNITVTSTEIFNFGTTDFRTMISKAKEMQPEMYIPVAFSPEIEIITRQMRELGISDNVTTIESFENSNEPKLFEGLWYVNAADPTGAFIEMYKEKFGTMPSLGAANVYDIVNIIVNATEKSGTKTSGIVKELYKTDLGGALGKLTIDPEGFVVSKAVLRIIKNGVPVTITD